MMMPANFTAVNSEVVYGGADLFSILADTTAPVWNAANVKQFNTNLITLVSNSFFQKTVNNTLGVIFSGTYVPGGVLSNFGSDISGIWNANYDGTDTKSKILSGMAGVLNVGLNIAGNLAAIYNLGFGTVKNGAEKAAIPEFSATDLL